MKSIRATTMHSSRPFAHARVTLRAALMVGALIAVLAPSFGDAAGRKYGQPRKPRRERSTDDLDLGIDVDLADEEMQREDIGEMEILGATDEELLQLPAKQREQLAWKATDQAMKLVEQNNMAESLPHFEKAVKYLPDVPNFYNNLGVTQMRIGQLKAAYANFKKAEKIDKTDDAVKANLKDLLEFARTPQGASMLRQDRSGEDIPLKEIYGDSFDGDAADDELDLDALLAEDMNADDEKPLDFVQSGEESTRQTIVEGKQFSSGTAQPPKRGQRRADGAQPPAKGMNRVRHTVRALPRISIHDFYKPENLKYRTAQFPFILTNVTDLPGWKNARYHQWSFDYFADHSLGSARADFYPQNMEHETVKPFMLSIKDAIREIRSPSGKFPQSLYHPGSYVQWNMDRKSWNTIREDLGEFPSQFFEDDAWLEGCMGDDDVISDYQIGTHWRMLLIGNKGAGMFNHWDILRTSSWQFQAHGRKKWHMCPPSEVDKMGGAGAVDSFNPDYEAYPDFLKADCFLDVVGENEIVFYPQDYWHQTENLDDENIAFSGTSIDSSCFQAVSDEFKSECSGSMARLPISKRVCKKLTSCYEWWQSGFAGLLRGNAKTHATAFGRGRPAGVGSFENLGVCADSSSAAA